METSEVVNIIRSRFSDLLEEQVCRWAEKVMEYMVFYKDEQLIRFQLDEITHYVTKQQILDGEVPNKPEQQYLIEMYRQHCVTHQAISHLQSPVETFGQAVKGIICRKCRRSEATMQAIQTRSADEPTSYYYQCKDSSCNHRWKDR